MYAGMQSEEELAQIALRTRSPTMNHIPIVTCSYNYNNIIIFLQLAASACQMSTNWGAQGCNLWLDTSRLKTTAHSIKTDSSCR